MVFEKTLKGKQVHFIAVKDRKTACVSDLIQIHKKVYSQQLKGLTLLSLNYCVKEAFVNKRHAKGVSPPPGPQYRGFTSPLHVFHHGTQTFFFNILFGLACEQALLDALKEGREKEGELATTSLEFEYLHRKSRCKMLIGGDDISNDVITLYTWFSMFVYIRARFHFALIGGNLTALSTGSHRGIGI